MNKLLKKILSALSLTAFFSGSAFAEYTPLIASTDFDGIRTDVLTTAGGVVSIMLVVVGLAILIRTLGK